MLASDSEATKQVWGVLARWQRRSVSSVAPALFSLFGVSAEFADAQPWVRFLGSPTERTASTRPLSPSNRAAMAILRGSGGRASISLRYWAACRARSWDLLVELGGPVAKSRGVAVSEVRVGATSTPTADITKKGGVILGRRHISV